MLPPGQTPAALQRFGLPRFAAVRPEPPGDPMVTVGGLVRRPTQVRLAELTGLDGRREQPADLHCVTTWSAQGLCWAGVPFQTVHELLAARVRPHPAARWIVLTGLDGYRCCLTLADATADDVLLADHLDGAPLTAAHGAPARLVAPRHYGYKSVKHVTMIEYARRYNPGSAPRWAAHPRGRVAYEERGRWVPGPLYRPLWRALLPRVRRRYAGDAGRRARNS